MKTRYFFGEWKDGNQALTAADVTALCAEGRKRARELADYPMDKILRVMSKVSRKWADPSYPPRVALEKELPAETSFSKEMIALGMKELCWTMDPEILGKKVETELGGIAREGDFTYDFRTGTSLSWSPLGVVLHILSGNVFLVGAGSLVEGLLTGNVTILKMSSGERIFLPKLIESIVECDDDGVVARSIALVDYRSSDHEVIAEFKRQVDGLVVWGGEDAVKAYRNDLPARTRLVVFGPKLSLGVVTRGGVAHHGIETVAQRLAFEVAIWDQNACTAPQLVYVQGKESAAALVDATAGALAAQAETLPAGEADMNTAVEIQKWRTTHEIAEARGEGKLRESRGSVDWTVVLDRNDAIDPSPLHRTIRVVAFEDVAELAAPFEAVRGYVQTVGIAAAPSEAMELANRFSALGALRILELGQMSGGEVDDPHDGAYDLPQLVNVNVTRLALPRKDMRPFDVLSETARRRIVDEKLRVLLDHAAKSPFYADRLRQAKIDGVADLPKIPILTRAEMEANMPPQSRGLATLSEIAGGYVTRSGGSTGEPKFSVYDGRDWEEMISHAVDVFRAMGFERGDRVANCMLAGDLYGSFVSFDHINSRLGLTTFAFAGKAEPEIFLKMCKQFRINAIQAIPSTLMPIVKAAKKLDPSLTLEKVMFAGQALQNSDREWLRDVLGVKRIASVIGANDGGQFAFQCEHMSGRLHHTVDDFNWVEIVDERGNPVPDGEAGRIMITSLRKHAFPLIRYEIGDAGRIIENRCPCGRGGRVIEYLGRSDDAICVALLNLRYRDFAAALEKFGYSALQLAARNEGGVDSLHVRLEIDGGDAALGEKIRSTIVSEIPKIDENLELGTLARVSVEVHPLGALPRNHRTGKIKALVDERS